MRSSLLIPLLVGLGAGVFALYSLVNSFSEAKRMADRPVEYADVLVAKTEIPYASRITEAMLERVRIPKPHPLKNTIADAASIAGRVAAMRIVKGTPVLTNMLAAKNTPPGATQLIESGYRTVSVSVPAGDVEDLNPGDRVDVLYAAHDRRAKQRNMDLMYNSVEVFAVGDKRIGMGMAVPTPEPKSKKRKRRKAPPPRARARGGQTTVKLLLPFDKAKVFAAAKLNGDIALLPRRFDDDSLHAEIDLHFDAPPEPEPVKVEARTPVAASPTPERRTIRVIQGGKDVSKEGTGLRIEEGGAPLRATPTVGERTSAAPQAADPTGYVRDLIERAGRASEERRALIDIGE